MLDTEESSSDTDADWSKLESKNPFLRLMALGKARDTMTQYLLQDIDGLDVKLLFGIYQRKVLGYEERTEEPPDILDRIIGSKKQAKQLMMQKQEERLDELNGKLRGGNEDSEQPEDFSQTAIEQDKFAKNDPRLKVADKSYLAQFYIKPSYNVNQSISTHANPSPLDIANAEYVDNPVVASLTSRQASKLADGYNLNFEPYASKYDNKLVVDRDANNELIGVMKRLPDTNRSVTEILKERERERDRDKEKSNMDLNFEF